MKSTTICENITEIKNKIEKTCRSANRNGSEVQLIAVSKTQPVQAVLNAVECGQKAFGENRMQELADKMEQIQDESIEWHMIGTLQSNKIRHIAQRVDWIHSVAKKSHFKEINKRAAAENRVINTLLQINISGEEQKSGCEPDEAAEILEYTKKLPHVKVRGFMGMAAFTDDTEQIRSEFRLLSTLLQQHQQFNGGNIQLEHLSMGMSADMEIAIEEGATMVRIGSDIFGRRNY